MESVSLDKLSGAKRVLDYQNPCPRCRHSAHFIAPDGDTFLVFCATPKCMKEDSDASKAIANRERRESLSGKYSKTTGAEDFNLGSLYKNASLSRWTAPDKFHQDISSWLINDSPFMLVQGGPGTGKTYLCASVLNYLKEQGKEVVYLTHRRFLSQIQEMMGQDIDNYSAVKKTAFKRFLIFDDLGSSTNTSWQIDMILELFDIRYSHCLKTLITSNMTVEELHDMLDSRIASRLLDKKNMNLEFWSEDRRLVDANP